MLHTQTTLDHYAEFTSRVQDGALVVVNHSGGKDSQAMYAVIKSLVPADQIVVVHADLGDGVEHLGVQDHIIANIEHPLHIAEPVWKDGSAKTLLDAIERRGKWPSAAQRYCTSDLKRGPCEKVIRRLLRESGRRDVISCFGFQSRDWYEFSPIHDLTTEEVFRIIAQSGQQPHPVYAEGNTRLSCVFCVLASDNDLRVGARLRPELAARYVALEDTMGHTFRANQSLRDIIDIHV